MKEKKVTQKGLTILELTISGIVFGLFMLAVYSTISLGLKSWQLGASKSDLHQQAEIVLQRLVKELRYSNMISIQIENYGEPDMENNFICFETPIKADDAKFKVSYDNVGLPVWQGHVLYYTKEPDGNSEKNLFRKFVPRSSPSIYPVTLTDTLTGLNLHINDTGGANVNTIARNIYNINFDRYGTRLCISVCFKKHIRTEASVSFDPGGGANLGTEVIELKASVNPTN